MTTTTLSVIIDPMASSGSHGIGRYTEELTRELIQVAPAGCDVVGIVSSITQDQVKNLEMLLPGIAGIQQSKLSKKATETLWRMGFGRIKGRGMVHSPSLLAPLSHHDRLNDEADQVVVTIHNAVPWTRPETLPRNVASWQRAMTKRAYRFADSVVVPSHAVAAQLGERFNFGDRLRVIGGAVSSKLHLPPDADARAARFDLPERYILSVGSLKPRKGMKELISSLAHQDAADLPLLIVGPDSWNGESVASVAAEAGLPEGQVRTLGFLADADLAVVLDRATVFVFPSLAEGFGLPVIEAFHFGTPVVHSDDPAVLEVAAGAGITVERAEEEGYPGRLAAAIASVAHNPSLAERLKFTGLDRAGAFSWRDSAQKVWQLHADL